MSNLFLIDKLPVPIRIVEKLKTNQQGLTTSSLSNDLNVDLKEVEKVVKNFQVQGIVELIQTDVGSSPIVKISDEGLKTIK